MRLAPPQHRAYSYTVTVAPTEMAVSLATVKAYLKITSSAEDATLTIFINAAIDFAEKFTRRDFITRTYESFRDFFPVYASEGYYNFGDNPAFGNVAVALTGGNLGFEIRRSPLQTIESIEYLKDNVSTLVDSSIYYNTIETDYSEVLTLATDNWPEDADRRLQAITLTFKTGFGDTEANMPSWVTEGILQHVANMWANRGDCSDCGDTVGSMIPATAKLLYLQNRIENL